MRKVKLLMFAMMLAILPTAMTDAGDLSSEIYTALEPLGYTQIPLKKNISNEFELKAKINGKHNISLIINFNMASSYYDKNAIEEMEIEVFETNQSFQLNSDKEDVYAASIDSLNIGSGKIEAMDLLVIDFEEYDALEYTRARGILGRDFLLEYHAIIDYGNQILYIKTK